jgi:putative phosphoribosyl transferase
MRASMFSSRPFRDRADAGRRLAVRLKAYTKRSDVVVLGLPRGGVLVAFEVARSLSAPLDIFLVRKLGVPGCSECAMGAIASGGVRVVDDRVVRSLSIPGSVISDAADQERREFERREQLYRGDHFPLQIWGQTALLVDDGIATGSTMRAAVAALRLHDPARVVVAVPVAPRQVCDELRALVDEFLCLIQPTSFFAVGQWYEDFRQITDQEVQDILLKASQSLNTVKA